MSTLFNDLVNTFKTMTWDEAKRHYYQLALKHHPDRGGDVETMKVVNGAWDFVKNSIADSHGKANNKHAGYSNWAVGMFDELMKTALKIAKISPSLNVEIAGYWIWVTGETKAHKDEIKKITLKIYTNKGEFDIHPKYHATKQAWYFSGVKSSGTGKMSLDEIRNTYKNQKITYTENSIV